MRDSECSAPISDDGRDGVGLGLRIAAAPISVREWSRAELNGFQILI
jgi:hypothetical protein